MASTGGDSQRMRACLSPALVALLVLAALVPGGAGQALFPWTGGSLVADNSVLQAGSSPAFSSTFQYSGKSISTIKLTDGSVMLNGVSTAQRSLTSNPQEELIGLFISANVHTGGSIYIEALSSSLCNEFASAKISNFQCSSYSGFMVTWVNRLITGHSTALSYQMLLLSVSGSTHVIFKYDQTSFNTLGSTFSSESGFTSRVGGLLTAYSFLNLMFNRQIDPYELSSYGNYMHPGSYLFKVDGSGEPVPVHFICHRDRLVYISTFTLSVMGGRVLDVNGPCINPSSDIRCMQGNRVFLPLAIDGNNIKCQSLQELNLGGKLFSISVDGGSTHVKGVTAIVVSPMDDSSLFVSMTPDINSAINLDAQVLSWTNPKSANVYITIITYVGTSTAQAPLGTKKEVALTTSPDGELNKYSFNLAGRIRLLSSTLLQQFITLESWPDYFFISVYSKESNEYAFSEPIVSELLRKMVIELLLSRLQVVTDLKGVAISSYTTWREAMANRNCQNFLDNLPTHVETIPAPCTLDQAIADPQFKRKHLSPNCFEAVVSGFGLQEACYNAQTKDIICGTGGAVQKVSNINGYRSKTSGKIRRYALDFAISDVLSDRYCCVNRVDLRQCGLFRKTTETNGCSGYKPLRYVAMFTGMSSIITFTKKSFTLNCPGPKKIFADSDIVIYGDTSPLFRNLACLRCFARYLSHVHMTYKGTETINMWLVGNRIEFEFNGRKTTFPSKNGIYVTFDSGFTIRRDSFTTSDTKNGRVSWRVFIMFDNGMYVYVELKFTYPNLMTFELYLRDPPTVDSTSLFGSDGSDLQPIVLSTSQQPAFVCKGNYASGSGYDFGNTVRCSSCSVYNLAGSSIGGASPAFSHTATSCGLVGACLMDYHLVQYSYPGTFLPPAGPAAITKAIVQQYQDFQTWVDSLDTNKYSSSCNCPTRTSGTDLELPNPFSNSEAKWSCSLGFQTNSVLPTSKCNANGIWDTSTPTSCKFIGICNRDCGAHGTCVLRNSLQTCDCNQGYAGQLCTERMTNPCSPNPCSNDGVCRIETNQSKCTCVPQGLWLGATCKIRSPCSPLPLGPCDGTGTDSCSVNSNLLTATCNCKQGVSGNLCKQAPRDCRTYCNSAGNDHCYIRSGETKCYCKPYWQGMTCNVNARICPTNYCLNGNCYLDANTNLPKCSCHAGFYGDRCAHSGQICNEKYCMNNGTCFLENGGGVDGSTYRCVCPPGYTGKRCDSFIITCLDLGPKCANGASCESSTYGDRCRCTSGWVGQYCTVRANNCNVNPCRNGGTCSQDAAGVQACFCPPPVVGEVCQTDLDECAPVPNQPRCENGGTCHNMYGSFRCDCTKGFTGQVCNQTTNVCSGQPCKNGGRCQVNDQNPSIFSCLCPSNWNGATCEEDVDECAPVNRPPTNLASQTRCANGGKCVNLAGGYHCNCSPKFYGRHCENVFSRCMLGVCLNGGTCLSEPNAGYRCQCRDAFDGSHCQIDVCMKMQCMNGGQCVVKGTSTECQCTAGFAGLRCDGKSSWLQLPFSSVQDISLAVGLVVFILIGVAIALCICCRQMRRLRNKDEKNGGLDDYTYGAAPDNWTTAVRGCKGVVKQHVNTYSYGHHGLPGQIVQN